MLKAVFLDYTGTIMQEQNSYALKMAQEIASQSSLKDISEIIKIWWTLIKEMEEASYLDTYLTEDQIVEKALDVLEKKYDYCGNRKEFIRLAHCFWSESPAFEDVKGFFEQCPLPIYIITNNGAEYVNVFLRNNDLRCAGIVCGDMVRAYKPHKELFERALMTIGCAPDEVVHIGDSVVSDIKGAQNIGICPILLDRKGKTISDEFLTITSLTEVLPLLRPENFDKLQIGRK